VLHGDEHAKCMRRKVPLDCPADCSFIAGIMHQLV
jgi:hypothetical protein